MNTFHKIADVGQAGGSLVALSIALAPETGGLSLCGAAIAIVAYLADYCNQRVALSCLKNLHDNFKKDCLPAWEEYDSLLQEFSKLCDMVDECSIENVNLRQNLQDCIQLKLAQNYSTGWLALPACALSCSDDVIGWLPYLKSTGKVLPGKLLSVLEKCEPLATRATILAPFLTTVCSGYVLLNTISNFSEPCAASKSIAEYTTKLNDFKKELQHLDDKMNLSIRCMKSEVARIQERWRSGQQLQILQQQLECLKSEMVLQQKAFDDKMIAREEQFKRQLQTQLSAQQEQFDRQLEIQRKEHNERLDQFNEILTKVLENK